MKFAAFILLASASVAAAQTTQPTTAQVEAAYRRLATATTRPTAASTRPSYDQLFRENALLRKEIAELQNDLTIAKADLANERKAAANPTKEESVVPPATGGPPPIRVKIEP